MRYEWQYNFTSKSLHFDKALKYGITLKKAATGENGEAIEGIIEIRPKSGEQNKTANSGTIGVSIPFEVEEGTPIAHRIVYDFAQRMAFEFGDFQISWALLVCERIPETENEKEEVGELTHHILEIRLVTVPEKQSFDPSSVDGIKLQSYNPVLMRLFNDAEQKTDLVDRYLTRFKILETEFIDNNLKTPAKLQLKSAQKLYAVFLSIATPKAKNVEIYEALIDDLVEARNNCAHLKKYKYGYLPGDNRLKELESMEQTLREICRAWIKSSKFT